MKLKLRVPQLCRDLVTVRRESGEQVRVVSRPMHAALLVAKLHSEAEEIALDLTNPEEYADLIESAIALAKLNGVTPEMIEEAGYKKRAIKGGLDIGQFWISADFVEPTNGAKAA